VSLQADSVDLDSVGFDKLDNVECTGGLGARVLDVVVVVVEFDTWVGGRGGCECNGNIGFSNGLVPQTRAVRSILIESCIILDRTFLQKLKFIQVPSFTTSQA
jgi:hypothetical protein